jgi:hypothetical protein
MRLTNSFRTAIAGGELSVLLQNRAEHGEVATDGSPIVLG